MDDLTPNKAGNATTPNVDSTASSSFEFPTGFFDSFVDTFQSPVSNFNCILGTVKSFNPTYGTLSVYIGGSATATSPIKMLNNFEPVIGGAVWLLQIGTDYLAIGQQRFDTESFLDSWNTWDSTAPNGAITFDSASGWVLNNGTVSGSYLQIGKTVFFKGVYTVGSSDTIGSTGLNISLPVQSIDTNWQGIGRASLVLGGTSLSVPCLLAPVSGNLYFQPQVFTIVTSASPASSTFYVRRSAITSTNYTRTAGNSIIFNGVYPSV